MMVFDLVLATRRARLTGVERFGVRLFEAMRRLRPDTRAFVRSHDGFVDQSGLIEVNDVFRGWLALPVRARGAAYGASAIIFPTAPASPLFWPSRARLCRIVHDAFPWTRSNAMPLQGRLLYRDVETLMLGRYDCLLGTTEMVAEELRIVFKRNDIAPCGNAPGLDLEGPQTPVPGLPARFWLAVGTLEPRKNYERIAEVVTEEGYDGPPVVIVGKAGWGRVAERIQGASTASLGRLIWLDELTDDSALRWLYRRALGLLSLSLAEGFNMPLVEAASSGAPVLCSDLLIHRRVAPPWANFLETQFDRKAFTRALAATERARPSPEAVEAYSRLYRWEAVAKRVIEFVEADQAVPGLSSRDQPASVGSPRNP